MVIAGLSLLIGSTSLARNLSVWEAGIPCVILHGRHKEADHVPGSDVTKRGSWNAVHVAKGWRLVHPEFVLAFRPSVHSHVAQPAGDLPEQRNCHANGEQVDQLGETTHNGDTQIAPTDGETGKTDSEASGSQVLPETGDGDITASAIDLENASGSVPETRPVQNHAKETDSSNNPVPGSNSTERRAEKTNAKMVRFETPNRRFDEYFFLTDPKEFVYRCLPDDEPWQLVDKPVRYEEFRSLPTLTPKFFQLSMFLAKTTRGVLRVTQGRARVEVRLPPDSKVSDFLQLVPCLTPLDTDTGQPRDLDRKALDVAAGREAVTTWRGSDRCRLEVRLPGPGKSLLDIRGGVLRSLTSPPPSRLLCRLLLESGGQAAPSPPHPLPWSPLGWGAGPVTRLLGVQVLTECAGVLRADNFRRVDLLLKVKDGVRLGAEVTSLGEGGGCEVEVRAGEGRTVRVRAVLPGEGAYRLCLHVLQEGEQRTEAAHFLLLATASSDKESARLQKWRRWLKETIQTGSEQTLRKVKAEFKAYAGNDDALLGEADDRLEFLSLQRSLQDAIKRRNVTVLEGVLSHVMTSHHKEALGGDVQKAEVLLRKLRPLDGYPQPTPDLSQSAISEIKTYVKPRDIVHDVMAAVLVLLGENPNVMEVWFEVKGTMSRQGQEGLGTRLRTFDLRGVTPERAEVARMYLQSHSFEAARAASLGIAAFYEWARLAITRARQIADQRAREEEAMTKVTLQDTHLSPNQPNTQRKPSRDTATPDSVFASDAPEDALWDCSEVAAMLEDGRREDGQKSKGENSFTPAKGGAESKVEPGNDLQLPREKPLSPPSPPSRPAGGGEEDPPEEKTPITFSGEGLRRQSGNPCKEVQGPASLIRVSEEAPGVREVTPSPPERPEVLLGKDGGGESGTQAQAHCSPGQEKLGGEGDESRDLSTPSRRGPQGVGRPLSKEGVDAKEETRPLSEASLPQSGPDHEGREGIDENESEDRGVEGEGADGGNVEALSRPSTRQSMVEVYAMQLDDLI